MKTFKTKEEAQAALNARARANIQTTVDTHRKLMRLFHPDNYTNAPAEVRTKMVEAYRLVSESRPDA